MTLDRAIAELYEVMKRYRAPLTMEGCPHCVSDEHQQALHAVSLHALTAAQLAWFAWKTMTTWGNVDDFRHFLPRLLELVVRDETDEEINEDALFGKLAYGAWRTWPDDEQHAIEAVLAAWWQATLATDLDHAMDRLKTIAATGISLRSCLTEWPLSALVELVGDYENDLWTHGRVRDRCFTDAQAKEITEWLLTPATIERLENAFFAVSPTAPHYAAAMSRAVDALNAALATTTKRA